MLYLYTGFEILAFPCNQFGEQEPGSNEEITNFVCTKFKSEFPIFDKVVSFAKKKKAQCLLFCDIFVACPIILKSLSFLCTVQIEVNGDNAAPIYKFLKAGKWFIFSDNIQWNFSKFLVDKDGKVSDRYYPTTSPLSLEVSKIKNKNYFITLFLYYTLNKLLAFHVSKIS